MQPISQLFQVEGRIAVEMFGQRHENMSMEIATYEITPLSAPDYNMKGFIFRGDPVVIAAQARWQRGAYLGTYEDWLRQAYIREARMSDGLVVDLGSGNPLTDMEVMLTDPYQLSVMYDDGVYSKTWDGPQGQPSHRETCADCGTTTKVAGGKCQRCEGRRLSALAKAARQAAVPCEDNSKHYHGPKCKHCGHTRRLISTNSCVTCDARPEPVVKAVCADNPKHYMGSPCSRCGSARRYISVGSCVVCNARAS